MPSEVVNQATRREWRELGFFYDCDDEAREWRMIGSRAGLLRFRDLLIAYVGDPRNAMDSEHEHYGPYEYLEIMTWPEPGFDNHAIHGPVSDLKRLARIVEAKLTDAEPGAIVRVGEEFAASTLYSLVLEVREDDFDPATADSSLHRKDS